MKDLIITDIFLNLLNYNHILQTSPKIRSTKKYCQYITNHINIIINHQKYQHLLLYIIQKNNILLNKNNDTKTIISLINFTIEIFMKDMLDNISKRIDSSIQDINIDKTKIINKFYIIEYLFNSIKGNLLFGQIDIESITTKIKNLNLNKEIDNKTEIFINDLDNIVHNLILIYFNKNMTQIIEISQIYDQQLYLISQDNPNTIIKNYIEIINLLIICYESNYEIINLYRLIYNSIYYRLYIFCRFEIDNILTNICDEFNNLNYNIIEDFIIDSNHFNELLTDLNKIIIKLMNELS
jgi:hypothetical protein